MTVRIVPQKHTADGYLMGQQPQAQVRVQRCGKSAPAASRGAGLVNPGQEQGEGSKGGHLVLILIKEPLEAVGNDSPR